MTQQPILTESDLEAINAALESIKMLRRELKRAQRAQIKLDFTEEDLNLREQQLLAIKQAYFPTKRQSE